VLLKVACQLCPEGRYLQVSYRHDAYPSSFAAISHVPNFPP
jgi:hypothetical protein